MRNECPCFSCTLMHTCGVFLFVLHSDLSRIQDSCLRVGEEWPGHSSQSPTSTVESVPRHLCEKALAVSV